MEKLKKSKRQGQLKIIFGDQDNVMPAPAPEEIEKLFSIYPDLDMDIVEWDHYLGYR